MEKHFLLPRDEARRARSKIRARATRRAAAAQRCGAMGAKATSPSCSVARSMRRTTRGARMSPPSGQAGRPPSTTPRIQWLTRFLVALGISLGHRQGPRSKVGDRNWPSSWAPHDRPRQSRGGAGASGPGSPETRAAERLRRLVDQRPRARHAAHTVARRRTTPKKGTRGGN